MRSLPRGGFNGWMTRSAIQRDSGMAMEWLQRYGCSGYPVRLWLLGRKIHGGDDRLLTRLLVHRF
jgi:hypothetical protein